MNVVNIAGHAVLVYGFHMGVAGVALHSLVSRALAARELIKGKVLETSPFSSREAAEQVAQAVCAEVVQVIGRTFVLSKGFKAIKIPAQRLLLKEGRVMLNNEEMMQMFHSMAPKKHFHFDFFRTQLRQSCLCHIVLTRS